MTEYDLKRELANRIKGEVKDDAATLAKNSRDTSLFQVMPELVAYPKDADDVAAIVKEIHDAKHAGAEVCLAGRSAGTDMSGGPLTAGVVVSFTEYMNRVLEVTRTAADAKDAREPTGFAVTEPGVYYRDFEKETLKENLILPSYPASRELCAMGGIVANNSGGERTLEYGKTEDYIAELEVVLSDGTKTTFKHLTPEEVEDRKKKQDLEGSIYREMDDILTKHGDVIKAHKPKVSKNSAGYALWNVRDLKTGGMNLAKLVCGSQGTLALWTKARLGLVTPKEHRAMLVIFLSDLAILPEVVKRVLPTAPESFESYDDKTFELAVRFLPDMLKQMGWARAVRLGIDFIPEAAMVATGGVPKLVLMAEFAEDSTAEADRKAVAAKNALLGLPVQTKIERNERESEKFWIVRRESFSLLRKNLHGLYASPFIDDFVVPPETYPTFLPKLNALLDEYQSHFIYTIAGHIGNGNFHIIPLMDLSKKENRDVVLELAPKVYDLVIAEGGTTTGEHNDGIIRTPYLRQLFGAEMETLFERTKKAFDPLNILNPGKKVGGTFEDIRRDMIQSAA